MHVTLINYRHSQRTAGGWVCSCPGYLCFAALAYGMARPRLLKDAISVRRLCVSIDLSAMGARQIDGQLSSILLQHIKEQIIDARCRTSSYGPKRRATACGRANVAAQALPDLHTCKVPLREVQSLCRCIM